jgi:UDP-glucose 4-epimerase
VTTYLLLGGRGVLGSGYREALSRQRDQVIRLSPRWEVAGDVVRLLSRRLSDAAGESDVVVIWAAGVGHIGASAELMRAETEAVVGLSDLVAALAPARRLRVSLLFASSAGALFGGHAGRVITAGDEPRPVTPYGWEKLRQEQVVRELGGDVGCRVVICRYSNVFGAADGKLTPRGLVATAVRATRLRQPMTVYVSPDTRRDLIFSRDAAAESLARLATVERGATTALICAGETRTVSELIALVGRVSGRRVPVTYAERPETRVQPRVLRFRAEEHGPPFVRRTPMETAVHLMMRAPLAPDQVAVKR